MQFIRRSHLYLGLFLLPWVILYGVTAFLFNHPAAFSDQAPAVEFGKEALAGTPLAAPPKPADEAARVVEAINARSKDGAQYTLVEPESAKYARPFATVSARDGDREVTASLNVLGLGGSARVRTTPPPAETAPFAVGGRVGIAPGGRGGPGGPRGGGREPGGREGGDREGGREGGGRMGGGRGGMEMLRVADSLHDRVKAAAPVALKQAGLAPGDVTVTSVPDLTFKISDGRKVWLASFNALAGSVSGRPADASAGGPELSARRFLTRLHTTHGYSDGVDYRWAWALIVDAMGFVMVFWGVSGLLMWWQLKATRRLGAVVVVLSIAAATWLGLGMHEMFTGAPIVGGVR